MANATAIEWTDATWNPVTGCTKISAGCDHCYAERDSQNAFVEPEAIRLKTALI
jgi:protein gp37